MTSEKESVKEPVEESGGKLVPGKSNCKPWNRIKDVVEHAYTDFINCSYLDEAEDNQNGTHVIVRFNDKGNIVIGIEV